MPSQTGAPKPLSNTIDNNHLIMIFKVVVTPDPEDGGFTVSCPALPGCHSEGETLEEALENIGDAIAGCVAVLNERDRTTAIY